MKIIPLTEAKAHLSKYGKICRKEPVIVTVNGRPSFQLVPVKEEEDLTNQLLEYNSEFQDLLKDRSRERTIPAAAARKKI